MTPLVRASSHSLCRASPLLPPLGGSLECPVQRGSPRRSSCPPMRRRHQTRARPCLRRIGAYLILCVAQGSVMQSSCTACAVRLGSSDASESDISPTSSRGLPQNDFKEVPIRASLGGASGVDGVDVCEFVQRCVSCWPFCAVPCSLQSTTVGMALHGALRGRFPRARNGAVVRA